MKIDKEKTQLLKQELREYEKSHTHDGRRKGSLA